MATSNANPGTIPRSGSDLTLSLSVVFMGAMAICLYQRGKALKHWRLMTVCHWLIIGVYIDSILFVAASTVLSHGFSLNTSNVACSVAALFCLTFYLSTKMIYYFLVERAHLAMDSTQPRMKSKYYLVNCFGALGLYIILFVLAFIYRFHIFDDKGVCRVGIGRKALIPIVVFDLILNIYLTSLFIKPLRESYSYQNDRKSRLRTITFRTFVGSICTLVTTMINMITSMALKGEAAWICLPVCSAEILLCAFVLHWVTEKDKIEAPGRNMPAGCAHCNPAGFAGRANNEGHVAGGVDLSFIKIESRSEDEGNRNTC